MAIKVTAKACSTRAANQQRHLLPVKRRRTRGICRAIQPPLNIFRPSPSSSRSLAGVRLDKALESLCSVLLLGPRQYCACQTGHTLVQKGLSTQTTELLQAAFTFEDLDLKLGLFNDLGTIKRRTGRRIHALLDSFPWSYIKNKSGYTLKLCQELEYFIGLHVRAVPTG